LYSKTEFVLVRLKKQPAEMHKYSTRPTVLATLALFLMNTLLFLTKFHLFLNLAIITFVNFAVSDSTTVCTTATSIVHSKVDYCNSL